MRDADLHPLVAGLVQQLLKRRVESYDDGKKKALVEHLVAAPPQKVSAVIRAKRPLTGGQRKTLEGAIYAVLDKQPEELSDDEKERLAKAAGEVEIPELVTVAGYFGGTVELGDDRARWWILYLDSQLQSWRLIPHKDILLHSSMDDDNAPFKKRDLLWVDADAITARGESPPRPEVQAQYLRGDFTRAGDLVAPAPGAPLSASTGVFCEVTTPSCCTKKVRP
jgi:hypothetical protein